MALTLTVTQPSNQSVFELGTATFTTLGTPSSAATVTYQWQAGTNNAGYSNITGATGASYSFEITLADSGEWYRCNISAVGENGATATATTNGVQLSALPDSLSQFAAKGEAGSLRYRRLVALGYIG